MYAYKENDECLGTHDYILHWTLIYWVSFYTSSQNSTTTTNKDTPTYTIKQQQPTAGQLKEQLITGDI